MSSLQISKDCYCKKKKAKNKKNRNSRARVVEEEKELKLVSLVDLQTCCPGSCIDNRPK